MENSFKSVFSTEMHDFLELTNSSGKDIENYRVTFNKLDRYMDKCGLLEKALSESLINEWLKTLNVSPKTKTYTIARIRRFARYLTALEIQAFEPEFNRATSNYMAYTFTDEDFASIIDAADNFKASFRNAASAYVFPVLLRILYGCGLRVGEAVTLRWEDIDLEAGIIIIKHAKYNRQRRVPMSSSLTDMLRLFYNRLVKSGKTQGFLFESARNAGKPYSVHAFGDWFLKILEQANICNQRKRAYERIICTHTLRHYFTFMSFQKSEKEGRPLEESAPYLSAYLGHQTFFGTEKYLTSDYTMYTDSHQRMNRFIGELFPEVNFE